MNADGSNVRRLNSHGGGATWSLDGHRIAFTSKRDGNENIYVMDADGSNATRLTSHSAKDEYSSWGAARRPSFQLEITAPSAATVGQSFDITARVRNVGGVGDDGGVSVSFPSLIGGSESSGGYTSSNADIQALSASGWDDVSMYKSGDSIWNSSGRRFPAVHLLVEASDDAWSSSSDRTLRLRVTPKTAGDFEIKIRGWICDGSLCEWSPNTGARDQQGHAATVKTVTVSAASPP